MKYLVLLFSLLAISAQAGFSMLKNGLLIDQSTNKPYTGVLESYNEDWDNHQVEFAQDYVNQNVNQESILNSWDTAIDSILG